MYGWMNGFDPDLDIETSDSMEQVWQSEEYGIDICDNFNENSNSDIDTGQFEFSSQVYLLNSPSQVPLSDPPTEEESDLLSIQVSSATQNLNLQQYTNSALFDNFINQINSVDSSFKPCSKGTKRKINLSKEAKQFKDDFYSIFTKRKKFPKPIVKQIHILIQPTLNLGPFTRSFTRVNDLYFEENAKHSKLIIQYLVRHKREIMNSIPELNNLPK